MIDYKANPFFLDEEGIQWIEQTIQNMTLDEKIGQLFCMNIRGGTKADVDMIFEVCKPGGVMYRPMSVEEELELTAYIAEKTKIPLLIAANLERGGSGITTDGTPIGSNLSIGATGNPENARRLGAACAREGKAVGANWAFAPVIDICYNFSNPITNTRTFGDDPELVARMGEAYTKGAQENGMAVSIKHFPGDGVDFRDQHLLTSINSLSVEDWEASYGKVYRTCIEAGALTCMVGHIMQPAYTRKLNPDIRDEDIMPATLSAEMMEGLLRKELGFNGMIVTDSTGMAGFSIPMPREKSVPYTIACGADMFLFAQNLKEDYEFMKAGVLDGTISEARLLDALRRILAVKVKLGLHRGGQPLPKLEESKTVLGCAEHRQWAKEIADQTITLVKEEKGVLPVTPQRYKRILFVPLNNSNDLPSADEIDYMALLIQKLENEGHQVTVLTPDKATEGKQRPTREYRDNYDLILYAADYENRSSQTAIRIEWALPRGTNCPHYITTIPTVFVSLENPYHLQDVPRIRTYINTYNKNEYVIQALVDKLEGRSPFKGKSPVDPFCGLWDARL